MSFPGDALTPYLIRQRILNPHPLGDIAIQEMHQDLPPDQRSHLNEKIAHLLCYLFGNFIIADAEENFISSVALRQAYQSRRRLWVLLDKAYREGKSDGEIQDQRDVQELLKAHTTLFCGRIPVEIIQEEARFSALSLPMPVQDLPFFARKPLTDNQLCLVEMELQHHSRIFYQQLSLPLSSIDLTPADIEGIERLFYSKAWGCIQKKYISWGELVLHWSLTHSRVTARLKKFIATFRFPLVGLRRLETSSVSPEFQRLSIKTQEITAPSLALFKGDLRAFSVLLTIQAFSHRWDMPLLPPMIETLFYELYHDEMLRQELFVCFDYTQLMLEKMKISKTRFGSPIFHEIFDMIKATLELRQSTIRPPSWFLEALYQAPTEVRAAVLKRLQAQSSRFLWAISKLTVLLNVHKAALHSKTLLKVIILIENPECAATLEQLLIFIEHEAISDIDSFFLYFLERPTLKMDWNRLHVQLGLLHSILRTNFTFTNPADESQKIELAIHFLQHPQAQQKLDRFMGCFFQEKGVRIDGKMLYQTLQRFFQAAFSLEEVTALKKLPFPLSTIEQIEFFSEPEPSLDPASNTTEVCTCVHELQKEYHFTELQTARLFYRFSSFENLKNGLEPLMQFLKLFEETVGSSLSPDLYFQYFFHQPFHQIDRACAYLKILQQDLSSIGKDISPAILYQTRENLQRQLCELTKAASSAASSQPVMNPPPIVQQLQHLLYQKFMPSMERLLPFFDLQVVQLPDQSMSLTPQKTELQGALTLLSPDLPSGKIVIGQWSTPKSNEECPFFELTLIDPKNFQSRRVRCVWEIPLKELIEWPSLIKLLMEMAQGIIHKTPFLQSPSTIEFKRRAATDPISIPSTGIDLSPEASLDPMLKDPSTQQHIDYFLYRHPQKKDLAKRTLQFLKNLMSHFYLSYRDLAVALITTPSDSIGNRDEGSAILIQAGSRARIIPFTRSQGLFIRDISIPKPVIEALPSFVQKIQAKESFDLTHTGLALEGYTLSAEIPLPLYWQFRAERGELTFQHPQGQLSWIYTRFIDHPSLTNLIHTHLLQAQSLFYNVGQVNTLSQ